MTTISIDIADVGGVPGESDHVAIWAPMNRPSILRVNGIVTTAVRVARLVRGRAEIENVEPGPVRIRIEASGVDSSVHHAVVPDSGTVTLKTLIEQDYNYTPEVLGEVSRLAEETRTAAEEVSVSAKKIIPALSKVEIISKAVGSIDEKISDADKAASSAKESARISAEAASKAQENKDAVATAAQTATSKAGEAAQSAERAEEAARNAAVGLQPGSVQKEHLHSGLRAEIEKGGTGGIQVVSQWPPANPKPDIVYFRV